MAEQARVLVDTCVWASFFKRSQSREKDSVRWLVRRNRAAIVGPVLSEVLIGIRNRAHADWAASALRGISWFDLSWDDWREAAHLGRRMAAVGHALPLTDLVVAAVALRKDCEVFSTDPHFDVIPDLKRYRHDD